MENSHSGELGGSYIFNAVQRLLDGPGELQAPARSWWLARGRLTPGLPGSNSPASKGVIRLASPLLSFEGLCSCQVLMHQQFHFATCCKPGMTEEPCCVNISGLQCSLFYRLPGALTSYGVSKYKGYQTANESLSSTDLRVGSETPASTYERAPTSGI